MFVFFVILLQIDFRNTRFLTDSTVSTVLQFNMALAIFIKIASKLTSCSCFARCGSKRPSTKNQTNLDPMRNFVLPALKHTCLVQAARRVPRDQNSPHTSSKKSRSSHHCGTLLRGLITDIHLCLKIPYIRLLHSVL